MASLAIDDLELIQLVQAVVEKTLCVLDWPVGRIALTEQEAAAALGVGRHILRDLRLREEISYSRLGKRVLYSRDQVLNLLEAASVASRSDK